MQQTGLDSMPPRAPRAPTDSPPKKRAPRQMSADNIPPDDLSAVFGHNLKAARLQRAMTAESLAKAVGMTQQAVSKVEAGKSGFTLPTMKKFADFFGLEVGNMLKLPVIEPVADDKPALPPSRKKPPS